MSTLNLICKILFTPAHSISAARLPFLVEVAIMTLSRSIRKEGRTRMTQTILIRAPRAINVHRELIISILE